MQLRRALREFPRAVDGAGRRARKRHGKPGDSGDRGELDRCGDGFGLDVAPCPAPLDPPPRRVYREMVRSSSPQRLSERGLVSERPGEVLCRPSADHSEQEEAEDERLCIESAEESRPRWNVVEPRRVQLAFPFPFVASCRAACSMIFSYRSCAFCRAACMSVGSGSWVRTTLQKAS